MVQTIINISLLFTVAYLMAKDVQRGVDIDQLKQDRLDLMFEIDYLNRREKENEKSRTGNFTE